jgi:rhodanese-related sulfurtransferase
VRRILLLLATGAVLGAAANAVSPRGISWTRPLGRGIAGQVADAGMVPVNLATARDLVNRKSVRIIDARRPELFQIGRLPGAVNMPWEDGGTLHIEKSTQPLLLYCDNEFCEQSLRLGEHLQRMGFRDIAVFVDGYEAWWNAGGAVDQD